MYSSQHTKLLVAAWVAMTLLLYVGSGSTAHAQNGQSSEEITTMVVVVTESDTGEPISQARITLKFTQPGAVRKSRKVTYGAKTDAQGRCKLQEINKGPIVLTVTAEGHQSYGKELQLERDNQVFEVKLKKPQPLI